MNNVFIFGPPGIGKSTLVQKLKETGASPFAIDLEDVVPELRDHVARGYSRTFIGAADLDPVKYSEYGNNILVMLTLPQDEYEARRAARDDEQPGKRHQLPHHISDWCEAFDDVFDYYVPVHDMDDAIRDLRNIMLMNSTTSLKRVTAPGGQAIWIPWFNSEAAATAIEYHLQDLSMNPFDPKLGFNGAMARMVSGDDKIIVTASEWEEVTKEGVNGEDDSDGDI